MPYNREDITILQDLIQNLKRCAFAFLDLEAMHAPEDCYDGALGLHLHDEYEIKIFFPPAGNRMRRKSRGAIGVIYPQTPHYSHNPEIFCNGRILITIQANDEHLVLGKFCDGTRGHILLGMGQCNAVSQTLGLPLTEFIQQTAERMDAGDDFSQELVVARLVMLLSAVGKALESESDVSRSQKSMDTVFKAQAIISLRYYQPDLSVASLAQILHVSPTHLAYLFQQHVGKSVRRTLVETRLQHAHALLQSGRYSVKEAASLSGWNNQNYFSNCFVERFSVRPSAVRK